MSTISASTTTTTGFVVTSNTTGTLVLQTGASPTTAVTIDGSQNVGLGTTVPSYKLDVAQSNPARGIVGQIQNLATSGQTGAQLEFLQNGVDYWSIGQPAGASAFSFWSGRYSGADGTEILRMTNTGNLGLGVTPSAWYSSYKALQVSSNLSIYTNTDFASYANNSFTNASAQDIYKSNGYAAKYTTTTSSGIHAWYTAASGTAGNVITYNQAMTLSNATYGGQQLLLNTTVNGNTGTTSLLSGSHFSIGVVPYSADAFGCIRIQDTNLGNYFKSEWGILSDGAGQGFTTISFTTGLYLVNGNSGASAKIYFDNSGNASKSSGAGSWLALSDSRIKTNVQTVTNGLSRILQLNPVTFDYKSPEAHNGKVHDKGFIADEFMVVYPDSVTETEFVADEDKQYIEEGSKAKAMGFNAEFYADLVSSIKEQQAIIEQLQADIATLKGAA